MDFYGGADQRAQWFKNAGMADPEAAPSAAGMPGMDPGAGAGVPGADQTFAGGPGPVMGPQRTQSLQGPHRGQQQASLGPSLNDQRFTGIQGYQSGLAPAPQQAGDAYGNGRPWQDPNGAYLQQSAPSQIGGEGQQSPAWRNLSQSPQYASTGLSYAQGSGMMSGDQGGDEGFHPSPEKIAQMQALYASQPAPPSWSSGQSYGAGRPQQRSMQGGYGEGPQGMGGHQNQTQATQGNYLGGGYGTQGMGQGRYGGGQQPQQNSSYAMDQQNQYRQQAQSQMQPQSRQRNSWGGGSWGGGQRNSGGSYGNSGGSGGGFNSMTSEPSSQPQRGWSGSGSPRRSSGAGGGMNEPGGSGGY